MDMEQNWMMTKEQMDNKLKSMNTKVLILRILTHGLIVIGLLTVPKNFFISLLCWLIAPAFGIPLGRIIKKRREAKKEFVYHVAGCVLRDVLGDDVEYNPLGELKPDKEAAPFSFPIPKDRIWELVGDYHIKATYNGVNFELGSIYINENEANRAWNESSSGCTLFHGPWLICDFGRKPECVVSVSTKSYLFSMKKRIVKIDNEQFSKRFCVNANDPREAFAILTPQMMETISAVANKSGGTVYISFMPDGKTHIGIDTQCGLFDGKKCRNTEELRQKFLGELRRLTDIIDMLNV